MRFVLSSQKAGAGLLTLVVVADGVAPAAGGNGTLNAFTPLPDQILRAGEPMDMSLAFRTAPQAMEYQVLLLPHRRGTGPCAEPQRSQRPEECIFSTYCGALRVGTPVFDRYRSLPPSRDVLLTVPRLPRGVEHAFQVVARNLSIPGNITRVVYTATQGTPTFTRGAPPPTHRPPPRGWPPSPPTWRLAAEVMAQSTTVVMVILLTAASLMVALIVCAVVTKRQIKAQYQKLAALEVPTAPPHIVGEQRAGGEEEEELDTEFA